MITGRRAPASSAAAAAIASAAGAGAPGRARDGRERRAAPSRAPAAPERRSAASARPAGARPRARRSARAASAAADSGACSRSATAPTDSTSAVLVDAEVRAQRRGRRLPREHQQRRPRLGGLGQRGQGVGQPRPLVDATRRRRGPSRAPSRRPSRPRRPRGARRRSGAPPATSALVTTRLPLPISPKTVVDAEARQRAPTTSAAVVAGIAANLPSHPSPRRVPHPR